MKASDKGLAQTSVLATRVERLFENPAVAGIRGIWVRLPRLAYLVGHKIISDLCLERAAALSFSMTLTFVPLAILLLSLFGRMDRFESLLEDGVDLLVQHLVSEQAVAPPDPTQTAQPGDESAAPGSDAEQSESNRAVVRANLQRFVGELKRPLQQGGDILNPIALLVLFLTVSSLFRSAERTFAVIWETGVRRGFLRKLGTFWLLLTLPPMILILAAYVDEELKRGMVPWLLWLRPLFGVGISFFAFTLVFQFLPNTEVRLRAAAWGAFLSAIGWELLTRAYSLYVDTLGASNVYGALGVIPIALFFIYLSWVLALVGATLTFCIQNYGLLEAEVRRKASIRQGTSAAVRALLILEHAYLAFRNGSRTASLEDIASALDLSHSVAGSLIDHLRGLGLLVGGRDGELIPGVAAERLTLEKVVNSFPGGSGLALPAGYTSAGGVGGLVAGMGAELDRRFQETTFAQLLPASTRND